MVRTLFIIALMGHGIGHVLFMGNAWGYWKASNSRAALFAGAAQSVEGTVGLLMILPLAGFLIAGWGLIGGAEWWRTAGLISAILSTVLMVLLWNGINTSSAFFAIVFNLVVIAAAIWQPAFLAR